MNWETVKVYNFTAANALEEPQRIDKSLFYVKHCDNSLYDTFEEGDIVRIQAGLPQTSEGVCLIDYKNNVLLRKVHFFDNYYILSQTWPEKSITVPKEDVKILGECKGILRI